MVTPHVGVAGLIELGRQSNVIAAAAKYLPAKQSPKGLGQGDMVEAFVVLSAVGGECIDDFTNLRRDEGLATMLGYTLPAASTARQWLDRFMRRRCWRTGRCRGASSPRSLVGWRGWAWCETTACAPM